MCFKHLIAQREGEPDESASSWIYAGLAALKDNYEKFNLGDKELIFHFDPYWVGPFAEGTHRVKIPFNNLEDIAVDNELISVLL